MSPNFDLRKMLYKTIERTIPASPVFTGYKFLSFTDSNYLVNIHIASPSISFSIYNISGITNSYEKLVIHKLNVTADIAVDASSSNLFILINNSINGSSLISGGTIKTEVIYGLISSLAISSDINVNTNQILGILPTDVTHTFYGNTIITADRILTNDSNFTYSFPTIEEDDTLVVASQLTQSESGINIELGTLNSIKANKTTPSDTTSDISKYFGLVQVNNEGMVTHYRKPQINDIVSTSLDNNKIAKVLDGTPSYCDLLLSDALDYDEIIVQPLSNLTNNKQDKLGGQDTVGKVVKINSSSLGDIGYLEIDPNITEGSSNLISSGAVYSSIVAKQNQINAGSENDILTKTSAAGALGTLTKVLSISNPGSDTTIPTEKAVRIALNDKQDKLGGQDTVGKVVKINSSSLGDIGYLEIDPNITEASPNLISSGTVYSSIMNLNNSKQDKLIVGTNIKALNGLNTLLSTGGIYAPTGSGKTRQVLISQGQDIEPVWRDLSFTVEGSVLIINSNI